MVSASAINNSPSGSADQVKREVKVNDNEKVQFFVQNYDPLQVKPSTYFCLELAKFNGCKLMNDPFDSIECDPLQPINTVLLEEICQYGKDHLNRISAEDRNIGLGAMLIYKFVKILRNDREMTYKKKMELIQARAEEIREHFRSKDLGDFPSFLSVYGIYRKGEESLEKMGGFEEQYRKFNAHIFGKNAVKNFAAQVESCPAVKHIYGLVGKESIAAFDSLEQDACFRLVELTPTHRRFTYTTSQNRVHIYIAQLTEKMDCVEALEKESELNPLGKSYDFVRQFSKWFYSLGRVFDVQDFLDFIKYSDKPLLHRVAKNKDLFFKYAEQLKQAGFYFAYDVTDDDHTQLNNFYEKLISCHVPIPPHAKYKPNLLFVNMNAYQIKRFPQLLNEISKKSDFTDFEFKKWLVKEKGYSKFKEYNDYTAFVQFLQLNLRKIFTTVDISTWQSYPTAENDTSQFDEAVASLESYLSKDSSSSKIDRIKVSEWLIREGAMRFFNNYEEYFAFTIAYKKREIGIFLAHDFAEIDILYLHSKHKQALTDNEQTRLQGYRSHDPDIFLPASIQGLKMKYEFKKKPPLDLFSYIRYATTHDKATNKAQPAIQFYEYLVTSKRNYAELETEAEFKAHLAVVEAKYKFSEKPTWSGYQQYLNPKADDFVVVEYEGSANDKLQLLRIAMDKIREASVNGFSQAQTQTIDPSSAFFDYVAKKQLEPGVKGYGECVFYEFLRDAENIKLFKITSQDAFDNALGSIMDMGVKFLDGKPTFAKFQQEKSQVEPSREVKAVIPDTLKSFNDYKPVLGQRAFYMDTDLIKFVKFNRFQKVDFAPTYVDFESLYNNLVSQGVDFITSPSPESCQREGLSFTNAVSASTPLNQPQPRKEINAKKIEEIAYVPLKSKEQRFMEASSSLASGLGHYGNIDAIMKLVQQHEFLTWLKTTGFFFIISIEEYKEFVAILNGYGNTRVKVIKDDLYKKYESEYFQKKFKEYPASNVQFTVADKERLKAYFT